uniref:Probable splicing factor YJU2B n=1 Tax=Esox lucius TaxID=8010 RepID=A0AAY5JXM8_ESOLU
MYESTVFDFLLLLVNADRTLSTSELSKITTWVRGKDKTTTTLQILTHKSMALSMVTMEPTPYVRGPGNCPRAFLSSGVRYNAEKKKVGNYYTTPIYRFRMKCHLCVNYIEMQTDPATCDYVIVTGAQRKEERWDMADNEQILTTEHSEKEKLETDPMYKLDHGGKDKEKLRKALPSLSELQDHKAGWKDDFVLNSTLRRKFRTEKKVMAEEEEKDNCVRKRTNLSIPLLPEKEEDRKLAALLTYTAPDSYDDRQQYKRKEISSRSWFSSPARPTGSPVGSLLQKLGLQGKGPSLARAPGPSQTALSPHRLIRRRTEGSGCRRDTCATVSRRISDPGPNDPGPNDPGPNDPGPNDPGPNDPGPNDPGLNDLGPNSTGLNDLGADNPGCSLSEGGWELGLAPTQRTGATDLAVEQPEQGLEMEERNQTANTTEEDRGQWKGGDCGTVLGDSNSSVLKASLVVDYSDTSDSDPGQ